MFKKEGDIRLVVLDVRSAHNVGSLFRTADGTGVSVVYLVGYTPAPIDEFKRPRKDITKVSLGAEISVLWEHHKTLSPLIKKLKEDGYEIVALEQSCDSIDYRSFVPKSKKIALIVGNEVGGIPVSVMEKCDQIMELPMLGKKESLNVGVAAGIALYELNTKLDTTQLSPLHLKGRLNRSDFQK